MTIDPSLPPITRLYQACEPLESLHPDDPRWVDFDAVRGEDNVVDSFARDIRRARADGANVKLFSGHRGVGKTSELFRLKALLEKGGDGRPGFVVVYCDVSDKLDVNDLDFPDLLVFVAVLTAHRYADAASWHAALAMFAAFCLAASAIYVVNDAADVAADRVHPDKSKRPFASGA